MRKIVLICLLSRIGYSQNIVANGSFENYSLCPTITDQLNYALDWSNPTAGSPDFFHICSGSMPTPQNGFGYQVPKSGGAYVGIIIFGQSNPDAREYIQTALSQTLIANYHYKINFWANRATTCQYSCSNLGYHISSSIVSSASYTVFPFPATYTNPTSNPLIDSVNWIEVGNVYTALGGEKYLTIGNFDDDASSNIGNHPLRALKYAYYYIDEVSVLPIDTVNSITFTEPTCANISGGAIIINFNFTPQAGVYEADLDNNGVFELQNLSLTGNQLIISGFSSGANINNVWIKHSSSGYEFNEVYITHTFTQTGPAAQIAQVSYVNPSGCSTSDGKVYIIFDCNPPSGTYEADLDNVGGYELSGLTAVGNLITVNGIKKGDLITNCKVRNVGASYISNTFTTSQLFTEPVTPNINSVTKEATGLKIILGSYQLNGGTIFSVDIGSDNSYEYSNIAITGNELFVNGYSSGVPDKLKIKQNNTSCESAPFLAIGINNLENKGIEIVPNPAQTSIFIKGLKESTEVIILDIAGRVIISEISEGEVDVSGLADGMYFIKIQTNSMRFESKFIKE